MSIALINSLEKEFNKHSNHIFAKSQKAYMRNQFDFYGLTANQRREIQNAVNKLYEHFGITSEKLVELIKKNIKMLIRKMRKLPN